MIKRLAFPALLLAAFALGLMWKESQRAGESSEAPVPSAAPAAFYRDEVAKLDSLIAAEVKLLEAGGNRDPAYCERLAGMWLTRVRLTGSYDDYAHAEEWIARAFSLSPSGLGPSIARARLHFTLHRLDRCADDIVTAKGWSALTPNLTAQLAELETDLAFQMGQYDVAVRELRKAHSVSRSARAAARLAIGIAPLGEREEASRLLAEAEARLVSPDPVFRAWLQLQRGLLELACGRPEKALSHYRRADRSLGGWWLVQEHIAEALAQTGELDEARAIYERVVADTGHPEMMAALAGVLEGLGDQEGAEHWRTQALQRFEARLSLFPEVAVGHALEFFLDLDDRGERALEMAEANFQLRPNGMASTLLARAYLRVGRVDDAVQTAEAALASGWQTADLLAVASTALTAAGRDEDAAARAAEAREISPRAFD